MFKKRHRKNKSDLFQKLHPKTEQKAGKNRIILGPVLSPVFYYLHLPFSEESLS